MGSRNTGKKPSSLTCNFRNILSQIDFFFFDRVSILVVGFLCIYSVVVVHKIVQKMHVLKLDTFSMQIVHINIHRMLIIVHFLFIDLMELLFFKLSTLSTTYAIKVSYRDGFISWIYGLVASSRR